MSRIPCLVVLCAAWSCVAGCSGGSGGAALQRNTLLTVRAGPGAGFDPASAITLPNGTLDLQAALLGIDRVEIEENTGEGGGKKGKNDGEGKGGGKGGEETDDIVLVGPFSLDIASGSAVLGSVMVFPGTFRQAELTLRVDPLPPMSDDSIQVTGLWHPSGGGAVPVSLHSELHTQIEVPIANGGIIVGANTVVSIELTFDLAAIFGNLDLSTAVVENGEILIDATHNVALLGQFEHNVASFVELENEHEH